MPYIKQEDRVRMEHKEVPENAGELNYAIHLLLEEYLYARGECYQTYNDMLGALNGVAQELYRRRVAPYEDKKIAENGDILFYNPTLYQNQ
jgi:hypothetical protein